MSEKRHRQQQRRHRRKTQGRTRGSAAHRPSRSRGADAELEQMLAGIAEMTARDADQPEDALDAEHWASTILGMMNAAPLLPDEDAAETFLPGFIGALESLGTRKALATLHALAAVTAPDYATVVREAVDRLAAR